MARRNVFRNTVFPVVSIEFVATIVVCFAHTAFAADAASKLAQQDLLWPDGKLSTLLLSPSVNEVAAWPAALYSIS